MNNYIKNMTNLINTIEEKSNFILSSPSKISLKEHCSFNLPAGISCPGCTEACIKCYARKGRFLFNSVQKPMAQNFNLIKKLNKTPNKAAEKILTVIPEDIKIFRIHSSGDFINNEYIDMWTNVIRERKNILFWAYTRSFDLNFQRIVRLSNFNLFASTDKYNIKKAIDFIKRYKNSNIKHAYGPWAHEDKIPKNSFICPVTSKKLVADGACEKCMLCVEKNKTTKNVVFLKH